MSARIRLQREISHGRHILNAESRPAPLRGLLRQHAPQHVLPAGVQGDLLWAVAPALHLRVSAEQRRKAVAS